MASSILMSQNSGRGKGLDGSPTSGGGGRGDVRDELERALDRDDSEEVEKAAANETADTDNG